MCDIFNEKRLIDDLKRRQSAKIEREIKEHENEVLKNLFQKPKVDTYKMVIDFSDLSDTLDVICNEYKKEFLNKKETKNETEPKKATVCRCNDCSSLNQCEKKNITDKADAVLEVKETVQKYFDSAEFQRKLKAQVKEIISEMLNK